MTDQFDDSRENPQCPRCLGPMIELDGSWICPSGTLVFHSLEREED